MIKSLLRQAKERKELDQNSMVSAVDALWHIVENVREMNRDIYMLRTGGIWIRFKEDGDNIKIANHITKGVWPIVDKSSQTPKIRVLRQKRKHDRLHAEV